MNPEIGADATGAAPLVAAPANGAPGEASASPFTMLPGAAGAMVCEGDVCFVPGLSGE
ncbi:hypothetical protein ACFVAJ_13590 [Agromyces sp. NPDC057679]|uniref:hypothetical protein n=1 Tax=Agromyces sp. NPDC057679 TaxID=3346207 RepID=UPI003670FA04